MQCVLCFETVSSLRVDLSKTRLALDDNVTNVLRLASLLGSKVGCLPMTNLGLSLGSFKARVVWNTIIGKVERRPGIVQIRGICLSVVIRFKRICGFWVENIFRRGNSRERRFYLWLKIERGKNRNSLFFFS